MLAVVNFVHRNMFKQHYDVIVVNPASSAYIRENKTRAHNMKIRKYAQLANKEVGFRTYGYWTKEVTKLIYNCCQIIAEKEGVSYIGQ